MSSNWGLRDTRRGNLRGSWTLFYTFVRKFRGIFKRATGLGLGLAIEIAVFAIVEYHAIMLRGYNYLRQWSETNNGRAACPRSQTIQNPPESRLDVTKTSADNTTLLNNKKHIIMREKPQRNTGNIPTSKASVTSLVATKVNCGGKLTNTSTSQKVMFWNSNAGNETSVWQSAVRR